MSQVDRTQATFVFQHRGATLNAWNRRFAVHFSRACPRCLKGKFLLISMKHKCSPPLFPEDDAHEKNPH